MGLLEAGYLGVGGSRSVGDDTSRTMCEGPDSEVDGRLDGATSEPHVREYAGSEVYFWLHRCCTLMVSLQDHSAQDVRRCLPRADEWGIE